MAGTDLNQKYTIEKYYSKNELSRALGTNLIEPFWKEIIDFRRRFSIELPIYDASHFHFALTFIDTVQGKTAQANDRVSAYVGGISKLSTDTIARHTFRREMLLQALRQVAKYNKLDTSDVTLINILEKQPVDDKYVVLVRYCEALENLKNNSFDNIDESFLAKNYAILRGEDELTGFYREDDRETASSKSLVDREYDEGIPSHMIDECVGSLMNYVNNFDVSLVARISAIFFMFNYIKPFESYNMELACLLAKRVIAATSIDTSSIYIPIEAFLNERDFYGDVSKEVKRTHDFTYAFLLGSNIINSAFDLANSKITQVRGSSIDEEIKIGTNEKKIKEEFGDNVQKSSHKEYSKGETKAEIQKRIEANVIEEGHFSEKELKAKMNDLLEMDPMLKKSQAHFYVHHCTMGRYYTIQQFVKFEGCVYETGRTSMDDLAKLGYYRRDQIKNKFVYTPINKE